MDRFVLAIDQGTTGSRALIVNSSGHIVADAYAEFRQLYPRPGWVEHDPEAIWATTTGSCGARKSAHSRPTGWPRSASPTSGRRRWCGTGERASGGATRSCGSAGGRRRGAGS